MKHFLPLMFPLAPEQVGHKFANLGRAAAYVRVPPALCVSVAVFHTTLGPERLRFLEQFFADLRATVGCFLRATMPTLTEALQGLELSAELRTELRRELEQLFGPIEGRRFAVRSSGATEDSGTFSFAGVYRSKLDVQGFEQICAALIECWQSYYSYPAVAARVRAGQYQPEPAMALIIQEMVVPELAGVGFSDPARPGGLVVEYIHGLGEGLVSGAVPPQSYFPGDAQVRLRAEQQALDAVAAAVLLLRDRFGFEVDVEWAWDACGLYIVQCRPVTVRPAARPALREPYYASAALYLDPTLPPGMELGECSEVYLSYVAKRASAYRLAAQLGIAAGAAHVVAFNGAGLHEQQARFEQLLAASPAQRVVLDISSNIRQVILPKPEVIGHLQESFSLTPSSFNRHTIIMRDFIKGQYGFISRLADARGLLIEYSPDGLLQINRGIAHCERIVLRDGEAPWSDTNLFCDGGPAVLEEFRAAIPQLLSFTRALHTEMNGVQIEWVLENGVPYFVDFSREHGDLAYSAQAGTLVIAEGVARGPLFRLDDDDLLYRLSVGPAVSVDKYADVLDHAGLQALIQMVADLPQKPIIVAQRPYAILSVLFEHVAGFVFAEGSLLCHLAILLREAHLPALISPELPPAAAPLALIMNGQLTLVN